MPPGNDLIRNSADLLVLSVLADGPLYGYAISKRVAGQSDDRIRLTPGVLYPLLHQLEKHGLLIASWETVRADDPNAASNAEAESIASSTEVSPASGGRRRKWYRLSAKGRKRLEQRIAAHRTYQAMIESFLPPTRAGEEGAS